ncbi:MAG TPA: lytic transglycosylase domain-containing protein [bacterium]|nr:lytic transglycosylase domain-containing protein [bacterium]
MLTAVGLLFVLATLMPVHARTRAPRIVLRRQQQISLVDQHADRYGIPRYVAYNLIEVESRWRQHAVSRRGARGIMQLMPRTARGLRVDPRDPRQNIEGGLRYLRQLYDRFKRWDLALAAYHSGPMTVVRHAGVPPVSRSYVRRILREPKVAAPVKATDSRPAPVAATPVFERRQTVTVSGDTTTTIREALRDGQVVWRAEEIVSVRDGLKTLIFREFRLIDGALAMVKEQTIVYGAEPGAVDGTKGE